MPTSNPLDYLYEEDITGVSPDNKIENELHLVTPGIEAGDFNIIVPKMMPYFKESMVVEHISSGTILVPGVDWQPAHIFDSASFETEWIRGGIYGSILIMNRNLTGQFRLREYQTLGGGWVLSNDKLLEILANRIADPRTSTYEIVSGKPHVFPPTGHNHPTNDWTGFADVVSAVDRMALAIEQQTQTWLDNPPVLMSEYYLKEEAEDVSRDIAEEVFSEKVDDEMAAFNAAINNLQNQLNLGMADRYTKTASDARYYQKSQVYTQSEINTLIATTIANYYTKTEADSRYYLKTETYTRTELDTRYRQRLTGNNVTYVRDSAGNEAGIPFTPQATPNTIVSRDASGNLQVGNSAGASDAVNNTRLTVVLGSYFTKTEADSRYYLKTETYTRGEMDTRYRQRIVGNNRVYTKDAAGNESSLGYNTERSGLTLVQRDNSGNFQSGNSAAADDVVNNNRLTDVLAGYYTKSEVYTKTEANTRYYLKSETYTRTEMDTRYRQRLTGTSRVYIRDNTGAESSIGYATAATANTVVVRDDSGNVKVSNSSTAADAVNNTRLGEALASALASYYLKTETYTRTEMDTRYRQRITGTSRVYTRDNAGVESSLGYTTAATANTVMVRDSSGNVQVSKSSTGADAVNNTRLGEALASALASYYLKTETYTRSEMDTRYRQRVAGNSRVYTKDSSGNESSLGYSASATANTVVVRDGSGNVKVGNSSTAADAVNNTRLDEALASALASYYLKTETYTRGEMDDRYVQKTETYAPGEMDDRYYQKTETYTRGEMDGRYYQKFETYTRGEMDDRYVQKTVTYTRGEMDDRYYHKTETYTRGEMDNRYQNATVLGTEALNTITTPGVYVQETASNATVVRNYPVANVTGRLVIPAERYARMTFTANDIPRSNRMGRTWMRVSPTATWIPVTIALNPGAINQSILGVNQDRGEFIQLNTWDVTILNGYPVAGVPTLIKADRSVLPRYRSPTDTTSPTTYTVVTLRAYVPGDTDESGPRVYVKTFTNESDGNTNWTTDGWMLERVGVDAYSRSETYNKRFLIAAFADRYTKDEADNRYYLKTETYTRGEMDDRYYQKTDTYTREEMDNRYYQKTETYTRGEMDNRYVQRTISLTANNGLTGGGTLTGSRTIGIADAIVPSRATALDTSDLDTITGPGFYYQHLNANALVGTVAAGGRNYPVQQAGSLSVEIAAGVIQTYKTYGEHNRAYQRGLYNGSWSGWRQVGSDEASWANLTGKPSTFPPPNATNTVTGGIRMRVANGVLYITNNGTNA